MCVRFYSEAQRRGRWLARHDVLPLGAEPAEEPSGTFPGSDAAIVRLGAHERLEAATARWGLQPAWAKDPKFGATRAYNARGETLHEKATFRNAFRTRRCIVPVTEFFERYAGRWQLFSPLRAEVLPVAGLWEPANERSDGEPTFCFATTTPNALIGAYQERMPVILRDEDVRVWLDLATPQGELRALMGPCPEEWLALSDGGPISRRAAAPPATGSLF